MRVANPLVLKVKYSQHAVWCWDNQMKFIWSSPSILWPLQLRGFCRVHWALNYITKALIITCSRGLEVFTCDFTSAPWCQLLQYAAHKCTLKLHNDTFHSFCNSPLSITPISVFNEATVKFVIKNHCFWYVFILLSNNHSSLKCS